MFANLNAKAVGITATLDQTLALAVRHGFGGIDLPLDEVTTVEEAIEADEKLQAALLQWGGAGLPVEFRRDEAIYERDLANLHEVAAVMQHVGCDRCVTWLMPCHDELDYRANFDLHVRRLKPVAHLLAQRSIRLGLEFVGPKTLRDTKRYPFIHTLEQVLELADAIAGDARLPVGVLLDSFHWYTSGGAERDIVTQLSNRRIVYVHVNDAIAGRPRNEQRDDERALPCDTGVIDAAAFMRALKTVRYDGPVAAEPFMPELAQQPADTVAHRVAAAVHRILRSGDEPQHRPSRP